MRPKKVKDWTPEDRRKAERVALGNLDGAGLIFANHQQDGDSGLHWRRAMTDAEIATLPRRARRT